VVKRGGCPASKRGKAPSRGGEDSPIEASFKDPSLGVSFCLPLLEKGAKKLLKVARAVKDLEN
jgi:hypothetical protein